MPKALLLSENFTLQHFTTRFLTLSLALLTGFVTFGTSPGLCDPGNQLHVPETLPTPRRTAPVSAEPDTLLVMASGDTNKGDVDTAIKECHGTITGTIGQGPLTVYIVKTEKGQFAEAEKKLSKDKHFCAVQRNYMYKVEQSAGTANDPYFSSEWHLGAVNAVNAWSLGQGRNAVLAVLDTGCNYSMPELSGKTYSGYDAINKRNGQTDVYGHGSMVATTAAAVTNNRRNTAAIAPMAYVYPVRVGDSNGGVSESAILEGIYKCGQQGIKIINISANADPPYSFANARIHPTLHQYLRWYHDQKNGLVFNSAGNNGQYDSSPKVPYLIVVSAIGKNYSLANFSTYGSPTWFTGPGVGVYCTDRSGRVAAVSGTSFSCPIVAAVAALVWGANPSLRNTSVEAILINTCYKAGSQSWTPYYGYGLPNAQAAVSRAR